MKVYLVEVRPGRWLWACSCGSTSYEDFGDLEVARIDLADHVRHAHARVAA